MNRRGVMAAMIGSLAASGTMRNMAWRAEAAMTHDDAGYGLIGQMLATPGNRSALAAILTEGTHDMPGCLHYLVGEDGANPDALWIVEVWTDRDAHAASLRLPSVQAAIARGRPLIAGFGQRVEFTPVGGHLAG